MEWITVYFYVTELQNQKGFKKMGKLTGRKSEKLSKT